MLAILFFDYVAENALAVDQERTSIDVYVSAAGFQSLLRPICTRTSSHGATLCRCCLMA